MFPTTGGADPIMLPIVPGVMVGALLVGCFAIYKLVTIKKEKP